MAKIYFIGAGPGDPELITIKGQRIIAEADVIIYAGSLVNPEILKYGKKDVPVYNSATMNLDEVLKVELESMHKGKTVARVHTGDPAIYGAIQEQMDGLRAAGVAEEQMEVVPGVSSFLATAAALKQEYTLPNVSQTIIITRMEGRTPMPEKEKLSMLAQHQATMCIFLSIQGINTVMSQLKDGGYPGDTPVAIAEGARIGLRLKATLKGDITLYEHQECASGAEANYFKKTAALTSEIFGRYDGLIYIMAAGIAVRSIAAHVVSKASDPAVLCMDECGKHCISLLSGHLGGANKLTREVAAAIGAAPVITTATDVHEKRAPDDIARELMMRVEPLDTLKPVNSVIAAGKRFSWFLDYQVEGAKSIRKRLLEIGISCASSDLINENEFDACVIITERNVKCSKPYVYLRPKNLYVGIGCKRGTSEAFIKKAFYAALEKINVYTYQVASLSSVNLKADEKGLLDFAKHIDRPIHFYTVEELRETEAENHIEISKFVEKTIGVGNVCQSAALRESMGGKTLLPKTKFASVTIAIAVGLSV